MQLCFIDINTRDLKAVEGSKEDLVRIRRKIAEADAVLTGLGPEMSAASGYDPYADDALFAENFSDYKEAYGFTSMFQGCHNLYSRPEEQWAYYARYIQWMLGAAPGRAYLDLLELLKDKNYFVLSTTTDHQVPQVFPEERSCLYQGDYAWLQCSQPCHDKLYPADELTKEMTERTENFRIPAELLPRCPYCGRIMQPWVRDDETFLEGEIWQAAAKRYENFLEENRGKKLLLLELGVGEANPGIVKLPFWNITQKEEEAFYITVTFGKPEAPAQLQGKSIAIADELGKFLHELKSLTPELEENGRS